MRESADLAKIDLTYRDRDIVLERDKGGRGGSKAQLAPTPIKPMSNNLATAIADAQLIKTVRREAD